MDKAFHDAMAAGYALTEPGLVLGSPMLDGELVNDARVQVALSMLNRHGLIAGATGTGKTKTLQLLAGQLSKAGVPVFVADIKGDLTGIAAPGDATNPKVVERATSLDWTFVPSGHPAEFLSLSGKLGAQVRATVHSFGPLLLGKVLDLNETQTSILSLIFKYCDDNDLPLLDLKDLDGDAQVPRVRRRQADPGRLRRDVDRVGRRAAALDRRPRAGRRRHLLRRARVRRRRPPPHDARGRGDRSASSSCPTSWTSRACSPRSCSGCSPSCTRRCPRRRPARSRSCASSSTRRTCCSTMRRRPCSSRSSGRRGSSGRRASASTSSPRRRPTCPSSVLAQLGNRVQHALRVFTPGRRRRPAQDRPDVPDDRLLRRREDHHLARHRRGAGDRPVAPGRARRRSPRPACCRPIR